MLEVLADLAEWVSLVFRYSAPLELCSQALAVEVAAAVEERAEPEERGEPEVRGPFAFEAAAVGIAAAVLFALPDTEPVAGPSFAGPSFADFDSLSPYLSVYVLVSCFEYDHLMLSPTARGNEREPLESLEWWAVAKQPYHWGLPSAVYSLSALSAECYAM